MDIQGGREDKSMVMLIVKVTRGPIDLKMELSSKGLTNNQLFNLSSSTTWESIFLNQIDPQTKMFANIMLNVIVMVVTCLS